MLAPPHRRRWPGATYRERPKRHRLKWVAASEACSGGDPPPAPAPADALHPAARCARADCQLGTAYQVAHVAGPHTHHNSKASAALGFTGTKLHAPPAADVDRRTPRQCCTAPPACPSYLENIATDYLFAPYHRYTPKASPSPGSSTPSAPAARLDPLPSRSDPPHREPGLSDPDWTRPHPDPAPQPASSTKKPPTTPSSTTWPTRAGIADLAAAWDFDLAPASVAAFRAWLRTQYSGLESLNAQWGTAYARWEDIAPELTDIAIRRTDANFSAWSDFKAWMDVAFATAIRTGVDALHAGDPAALAALEGGQLPGWGGYDYALLAPALDVMEIYDSGNALDLATAFNPALIPLRTTFGTGLPEEHGVWHNLLHGGRGMVVWDEADDIVDPQGAPLPRGQALARLVGAVTAAAPTLRHPAPDPGVAVIISQASFRLRWLLDRQAGDHDWPARDAEREYDDNAWRASRRVMLARLAELGVQPRLLSNERLTTPLWDQGVRLLLLPHVIALSDAELAGIAAFQALGGTVLADTEPGLFDGHGRRRAAPPLPGIPHPQAIRPDGEEISAATLDALSDLLTAAGTPPRATLRTAAGTRATGYDMRWFASPAGPLISIQMARLAGAAPHVMLQFPGRPAIPLDVPPAAPLLMPSPPP